MGDPAGPENCTKSGSLGGRRNSQNASMDDVRFSPPTRPPLAKRLGNSEKLAASGGGCAVALPACLTMVKHKGNVSHVGITCPSLGGAGGSSTRGSRQGIHCPGFQAQQGSGPATRACSSTRGSRQGIRSGAECNGLHEVVFRGHAQRVACDQLVTSHQEIRGQTHDVCATEGLGPPFFWQVSGRRLPVTLQFLE